MAGRRKSASFKFENSFKMPAQPAYPEHAQVQRKLEEYWGAGLKMISIYEKGGSGDVPINRVLFPDVKSKTDTTSAEMGSVLQAIHAVAYEYGARVELPIAVKVVVHFFDDDDKVDRRETSFTIKEDDEYYGEEEGENADGDDADEDDDDDDDADDDDADDDDDDDEEEDRRAAYRRLQQYERRRERMAALRDRPYGRPADAMQTQVAFLQAMQQQTLEGMQAGHAALLAGVRGLLDEARNVISGQRQDVRAAQARGDKAMEVLIGILQDERTANDNEKLLERESWERVRAAIDMVADSQAHTASWKIELAKLEVEVQALREENERLRNDPDARGGDEVISQSRIKEIMDGLAELGPHYGPMGAKLAQALIIRIKQSQRSRADAYQQQAPHQQYQYQPPYEPPPEPEPEPEPEPQARPETEPIRRRNRTRGGKGPRRTINPAYAAYEQRVRLWFQENDDFDPLPLGAEVTVVATDVADHETIQEHPLLTLCLMLHKQLADGTGHRLQSVLTPEEWQHLTNSTTRNTDAEALEDIKAMTMTIMEDEQRQAEVWAILDDQQAYTLKTIQQGVMAMALYDTPKIPHVLVERAPPRYLGPKPKTRKKPVIDTEATKSKAAPVPDFDD